MTSTWVEPPKTHLDTKLHAVVGGHPLITQTLIRRGITTAEAARAFLDPETYLPTSPYELPGIDAAVERLTDAIRRGQRICVWGDFDVDGQSATAVLVSTLQALEANVGFHIPVRASESHGVNLPVLEQIIADGVQLILTCDTGITAHEAVEFARTKNVDFIITDHHELPHDLPEAYAVVNPRLMPDLHPLATLPGVGAAYKLAEALCETFKPPNFQPSTLHDLTALGIIADVAILRGDARHLVQRGLERLRGAERAGLRAMMEAAGVNPAWLTETHIGFVLGPRLNALGRLSDANTSIELLTTQDWRRASVLAATLEGLNAQRQLLTRQIFQAVQAQLEHEPDLLADPVLVLSHPTWPSGIIGIVASRLVERYNRPVVLLSTPDGELARGSARSVAGCNITAAIAEQRELLTNFGGHPMAAGLSLEEKNISRFRRGLIHSVQDRLGNVQAEITRQIDAYLTLPEIKLELAEDLSRLAPFGTGNPALIFAISNLTLKSHSTIGRGAEHLQLIVEDEIGNTQKVLWWQGASWPLPTGRFDMACTIQASDFGGQRSVQLEWVDFRPQERLESTSQKKQTVIHDYRLQASPLGILKQLTAESTQIWGEADAPDKLAKAGIPTQTRQSLVPSSTLAIWTTPPGPEELKAVLEKVKPEIVYLFSIDPETTNLAAFLKRLAGLSKFVINQRSGLTSLTELAAGTAQRETIVRKGLAWLAANGHIAIVEEKDKEFQLSVSHTKKCHNVSTLNKQLEALLTETNAYRTYFHQAEKARLIERAV